MNQHEMSREMVASLADVIPELILLGTGIAILFYALFAPRRVQWGAGILALAGTSAAALAAVAMLGDPQHLTFFDTYSADDVAVWAKIIIVTSAAAVVGLSVPWFRRDPRHGEYYTLLLFSSLGVMLLSGATDLMEIVLALLLSSATGYVLAAYHRRSRLASEAAVKYFLISALTTAAMLIGVAFLFGAAGTTTLSGLARGLTAASPALIVAVALVLTAFCFKMGALPAHSWMPDVAQGAPAPVAAFLTAVPKVGALIVTARFVTVLPDAVGWRPLVALLSVGTMTLGNLACLWQDDVRRLLGWSAVSQTGYGLMAVTALGRSDLAVESLLVFLVAYVLANLAAFGVIVELRGRTELAAYAGLGRAQPVLAAALVVSFLSFIGIPPLIGFGAKLLLFSATIDAGYAWLAAAAAVNTVVSIFYYTRVLMPAYFGTADTPVPVLARSAAITTYVLALAVVVLGIVAEPLVNALRSASLLSG